MLAKVKSKKTAREALHRFAKPGGAPAASKNSRRPSAGATNGTKTAHQSAPEASCADSPGVDIDRAIADCVSHRVRCTVRIRPLPSRCRIPDILALCPSAVAARLPWNSARRRHKGVAFLEFACPEVAAKHAKALAGSRALGGGRELATSIRTDRDALAGSPADTAAVYSRTRVVVSSLGEKATPARLLELAPAALNARFPSASSFGGLRGRGAPRVAVVTFADTWQALDAVRSCQGAEVAGCKTSWMLEKLTSKPKPLRQVDKRTLVLSGVTNALQDSDLLRALPRCSGLERRGSGTAVAVYAAEDDCAADLAALPRLCPAETHLRAAYGHAPRSSASASRIGRSLVASVLGSPPESQRVRLLAVDLPVGTKKAQLTEFLGVSGGGGGGGGLLRASVSSDGRLAVLNFASREDAVAARCRFRGTLFNGVKVRTAFSLGQLAGVGKRSAGGKKATESAKKKAAKTNAASFDVGQI